MTRPLIGISCDTDSIVDRRGVTVARHLLQAPYVDAVAAAGGDPVLVAHLPVEFAARLVQRLDGVVISGGDFDVPPELYGQTPHPKLGGTHPARSAFERALIQAALARGLPILGVCGGMQLLNVCFGGSLFQDLSLRPDTAVHQQPQDKRQPQHEVRLAPGSLVRRLAGASTLQANSTHHQAVDRVGAGLVVSGTAPDGCVEVIESPEAPFVLGVQWHPETLAMPEHRAIYAGLVAVAALQNPSK